VNAISKYSDWSIGQLHVGTLGWNGLMIFGMIYWLCPNIFQAKLWSPKLANLHFWLALSGVLLYALPLYIGGILQATRTLSLDDSGRLEHSAFMPLLTSMAPFWLARSLGGTIYTIGLVAMGLNVGLTWMRRPAKYAVAQIQAACCTIQKPDRSEQPTHQPSQLEGVPVLEFAKTVESLSTLSWHRNWERWPLRFGALIAVMIGIALVCEALPVWLVRSNIPRIASVKPYTPLELMGREIYVSEGCHNCHSQMIRSLVPETMRYTTDFSEAGEFAYDHPSQWGTRRIGPDLAREGGRQGSYWHWRHLDSPQGVTEGSVMPSFQRLLDSQLNTSEIPKRVHAATKIGIPYDKEFSSDDAILAHAKAQSQSIAAEIVMQGGPVIYADRLIEESTAMALIAYLQRLGKDRYAPPVPPAPTASVKRQSPLALATNSATAMREGGKTCSID
jgi:cytochrome c oxidase cbb3-type subunit I/II